LPPTWHEGKVANIQSGNFCQVRANQHLMETQLHGDSGLSLVVCSIARPCLDGWEHHIIHLIVKCSRAAMSLGQKSSLREHLKEECRCAHLLSHFVSYDQVEIKHVEGVMILEGKPGDLDLLAATCGASEAIGSQ
jgi:hypothetical protein